MSLVLQVTVYNSWKAVNSILNMEEIITFISLSGSYTFYFCFIFGVAAVVRILASVPVFSFTKIYIE
jgi:hypothetical protein